MAYDESLAERIRAALALAAPDHREIALFGGLCWTVNTHMAVGVGDAELMVAVGSAGVPAALEDGAHPMTMGSRTMAGVVGVADPDDEELARWVDRGVSRARALPPKPPKPPRR